MQEASDGSRRSAVRESAARAVEGFGAATKALATAFPVAAREPHADNRSGGSSAPPQPLRAGERFPDLRMAEACTPAPPEGGGPDGYRCRMIDPGLTMTAFLTGTPFAPESVAIAHHAVVYAVPPGCAAAVREQEREDPLV
ncbi:hypothetical protein [Streptomyces canus]|uniref:hypothetical protein n=1 Tax=Streptomyces canus TaxID=58343 RepID=UPI00036AE341|nr:hypothetical protein [Streptomyces canus]